MDVQIKLDLFEGPLDLLLHLVEKSEVDIYEVPIAEITNQYMAILSEAKDGKLEIASEFLVMAATLIAIKSRMLLPRLEKTDTNREQASEEWFDPREQLIERLLEYKKYKRLGEMLNRKEKERHQLYLRPPVDLTPYAKKQNPVEGLTPDDLLETFVALLKKEKEEQPMATVAREEISVSDRMKEIIQLLEKKESLTYSELVPSLQQTKEWEITTFLALLELIKCKQIVCHQQTVFTEIWIRKYEQVLVHG